MSCNQRDELELLAAMKSNSLAFRTSRAIEKLERAFDDLWDAVGGRLEVQARDIVPEVLETHWRLLHATAQAEDFETGCGRRSFDLVIRGVIDGHEVTVICDINAKPMVADVRRFTALIEQLRAANPGQDIRTLFFGYRADREAQEEIVNAGAAMVFTRGVIIPAA